MVQVFLYTDPSIRRGLSLIGELTTLRSSPERVPAEDELSAAWLRGYFAAEGASAP